MPSDPGDNPVSAAPLSARLNATRGQGTSGGPKFCEDKGWATLEEALLRAPSHAQPTHATVFRMTFDSPMQESYHIKVLVALSKCQPRHITLST